MTRSPGRPEPPRVLVTGGSGFLGLPCLRLLRERGWAVDATSRRPPEDGSDGVRWWTVDLLDPEQVERAVARIRPSHLLHLGWTSGRDGFRDGLDNYRWVGATLDLLRCFTAHGGRRVVAVGTGAEYDWSDGVCSESTTPLRPSSTYGLCKRATYELFTRWSEQHPELSCAWGRLFFLFGPREDDYRLLPSIVDRLLRDAPAECRFDRLRRDYLAVDDAARGLVDLLASDVEGAINLASGEAVSLGDLVGRAADHLGRRQLLRLGGEPSGEHPAPVVVADVTRARDELGWRPALDLGSAIARAVDARRSELADDRAADG